jgi:DUF4097 and DUF4098 domain-containing protein YvlB
MNKRHFTKGEISKEVFSVIMHDLESLDLRADIQNNNYHYKLLKNNLQDIFGVTE